MIRSGRIPPVLSRICTDGIHAALLATTDGELLGTSYPTSSEHLFTTDFSELGALVTEIAADYMRLGHELVLLDQHAVTDGEEETAGMEKPSQMQFLELELEQGRIGVAPAGVDCLVLAMADPNVPSGMLKARLQALSQYVEESLSPLTEQHT